MIPRTGGMASMLAMAMLVAGSPPAEAGGIQPFVLRKDGYDPDEFPGRRIPRRSSFAVRHDPNREKTAEDLKNIEAARLRRERRDARRARK